ncbi:hypothetical protein FALCPG4_017923 [Fusarium falciforme]
MSLVVLKRYLLQKPHLKKWEAFVPNMSLVGLAMTIPRSTTTVTVAIGSVIAWVWHKHWPKSHTRFMYAVASGGIAGEGVGYVVLSVLQIAGVGGSELGTMIGCPGGAC